MENLANFGILVGSTGLFLLGMTLMTSGLALAVGNAQREILATWASTPLRGLLAGAGIATLLQ